MSFIKNAINWIKEELSELYVALEPGLTYIEKNVPADLIKIAEAVLGAAVTGTPWATILSSVLSQAENAGLDLAKGAVSAEEAATGALSAAQLNILGNGTSAGTAAAPVTPAPSAQVAASGAASA